jgi:hypothetical protein
MESPVYKANFPGNGNSDRRHDVRLPNSNEAEEGCKRVYYHDGQYTGGIYGGGIMLGGRCGLGELAKKVLDFLVVCK